MAKKSNYIKNGSSYYRVTLSLGRDSNGKLIRKEFYGKTKKEAEQKKLEFQTDLSKGLDIDYKTRSLGPVMEIWLNDVIKPAVKPSTYMRYEGIYRNYIKESELYALKINNIKSTTVQRYYNNLNEKNKSFSSIKNLNKLLKNFFNYACDNDFIIKNPVAGKRVFIPGNPENCKRTILTFNDNEIKLILNAPGAFLIKDIALVCLNTGLRRGECLGLKWSDIDYIDNIITIQRSVKSVAEFDNEGNKVYKELVQLPKTKNSIRTIPLPKSLIPILKRIKTEQKEQALKTGGIYKNEDGFIFTTELGKLINDTNLSRSWKRFLNRLDIDYKNFHALRHTYATKQFEAGIPLKTVSVLLGHSDIYITANTYTHVLKEQKNKAVDILENINCGKSVGK